MHIPPHHAHALQRRSTLSKYILEEINYLLMLNKKNYDYYQCLSDLKMPANREGNRIKKNIYLHVRFHLASTFFVLV